MIFYKVYDCNQKWLKVKAVKKIIFENKSEFRNFCKQKLLKKTNSYQKDKATCKELLNLLKKRKPHSILAYIPLACEVSIVPILNAMRRKSRVYVPFMECVSFKMVPFRLPLHTKEFGIREPNNSFTCKKKIDLAIVPVLGVDGAFKRIGFGKGMYDRFFESLRYRPEILFVQRQECFTKEILSQEHDIEADIYLTPHKTIIKRGKYGSRISNSWSNCGGKRRRRIFCSKKNGISKL